MFDKGRLCSLLKSYTFIRRYSKPAVKSDDNQLGKLVKLLESMPKSPSAHQKARMRHKNRSVTVPGRVALQVLGTGAEGSPKTLYMFSDHSRYLFNCGEGTQRLAHEHKMKLSKLEHIFITQPCWENMGGLPGLALTIQDAGVSQITLHGPQGLDELFVATRRFVVLRDLKIKMAECEEGGQFEDSVMTVEYVPLVRRINEKGTQSDCTATSNASTSTRRSRSRGQRSPTRNSSDVSDDDTDYYAHERKKRRRRNRSRSNRSRSESERRDAEAARLRMSQISHEKREHNTAMCYVCRLHARPGSLCLEKCVAAGVPPGPLLGQLKAGNDISLEDGTVVRSADVCNPDEPGPVMLVVDCPTVEYLEALSESSLLARHQASAQHDCDRAYVVVHFTPARIVEDPRYHEWVDKFSPSTCHLLLNESNTCMGSVAVHRIQHQLNLLHEGLFPLLRGDGQLEKDAPASKRARLEEDVFVRPRTLCSFQLRPRTGLDRSNEVCVERELDVAEALAVEGVREELDALRGQLSTAAASAAKPACDFPRIVFLGTGSCIPNKTRNTSGILVQASERTSIMLDCGEGTHGQLVRLLGRDAAAAELCRLRAVFISHLHADHHIGLVALLKARRRALQTENVSSSSPAQLLLLAPAQILAWLRFYDRRFERIDDCYDVIGNAELLGETGAATSECRQRVRELEMRGVATAAVRHCPNAFGVRFDHRDGWSLTYSGDTMPCDRLGALGLGCDLLIHEATMEDELAREAAFKMHSTTSQAIEMGRRMGARHTLLTHFSQRYAKLPRFNDNFADNVGIAFDNMRVRFDDLPLIPLLYPALRTLFAEHYGELEQKAFRRQLREEKASTRSSPAPAPGPGPGHGHGS